MKALLILPLLSLALGGCAETSAPSAPPPVPAATGAEIIYDEQGNYALLHFNAGVPVPDAAAENTNLVMKPAWASFEAFEGVP